MENESAHWTFLKSSLGLAGEVFPMPADEQLDIALTSPEIGRLMTILRICGL